MIFFQVFIFILIQFIHTISVADTYYISPTGNDNNPGSLTSPWHTVGHAWRNSGGGDTILVRAGTYSEVQLWFHMNSQGSTNEQQLWTLKAYPGEVPVFTDTRFIVDGDYIRIQGLHLTGTSFIQAVSWAGMHEHIEFLDNGFSGSATVSIYFNANHGLVEGNTIHSASAVHGIYVMHGDSNVIRNNYVSGVNKYGIHIYDEQKYSHPARITNLLVEKNTVIGSQSRSGIIISAGQSKDFSIEIDGVLVRNNVVTNNFEDGITIRYYGSVRNIDIYNNVMHRNVADGLRISANDVDNITIKNNIFSANGVHIDVYSSLNNLLVSHNLYWKPSFLGSGATDNHAVYQDPLFVNDVEGDFHLRPNSPAIDAGVDVGLPYNGNAPDLGCFEYDQSSSRESSPKVPGKFNLLQNYPNPFNPHTQIFYSLRFDGNVDLSVFNIAGQYIKNLVRKRQSAGLKSATWNGKDENDRNVSSGIYFYRLRIDEFSATRKMLIVR